MANEIQINSTLRYSKNGATASLSTSFFDNQTGVNYEGGTQSVATSEGTLQKNNIGTIGYVAIRNTDGTNFVSVGSTTAQYTHTIPAGKGGVYPWNHANVYVKADTAAVIVEYLLIEL